MEQGELFDNLVSTKRRTDAQPNNGIFPFKHFKAILFRKYILLKRSYKTILVSSFMTILFSMLTIALEYIVKNLIKDHAEKITFRKFKYLSRNIGFTYSEDEFWAPEFEEIIKEIYKNDTNTEPNLTHFNDVDELNKYTYDALKNRSTGNNLIYNFQLLQKYPYKIVSSYNSSQVAIFEEVRFHGEVHLTRAAWKSEFGNENDFSFSKTMLSKRSIEIQFGLIAPLLITAGIISIIPLLVAQPVLDISGETRSYMVNAGLKIFPYWTATFVVDLLLWVIICGIVWLVLIAAQLRCIIENAGTTLCVFLLSGPSIIMLLYCSTFLFRDPGAAARQMYIFMAFFLILSLMLDIDRNGVPMPIWVELIYSLLPQISMMRILNSVLINVSVLWKPLSYYWTEKESTKIHFMMFIVDFFLYGAILTIIENTRDFFLGSKTRKLYKKHFQLFGMLRNQRQVAMGAIEMEEKVKNKEEEFAVEINHVSKVFLDNNKNPIPAVNCVSIGIKPNSTFGFLGANGAGKTTLMRIITGTEFASDGFVLINGERVKPNSLSVSICPQFNNHLCADMTPSEHFKMYGLFFGIPSDEVKVRSAPIMETLELDKYCDTVVGEMSGGMQRKLAVAIAFFSPAQIVLLDEPTSSLDPYARHTVHNLIEQYKGRRTFMLCSHILAEVEALCDTISIMVRGTVYAVGSAQRLTSEFGYGYDVDLLLDGDNGEQCNAFFNEAFPGSRLKISRMNARVYTISSEVASIDEVFRKIEIGKKTAGFSYYTVRTSSLESVFMEIMRMSANPDRLDFPEIAFPAG